MSDYWLISLDGAQLGPVSLQVIGDLAAAGRLRNISRASRDGATWLPVYEVPEIDAMLSPAAAPQQDPAKVRAAAQLEAEVARLRALPLHEALGVASGAERRSRHAAFFQLVRRLTPASPVETSNELRRAQAAAFEFLSQTLLAVASDSPPQPNGMPAHANGPARAAQPLPPMAAAPPRPQPAPVPANRLAVPPVIGPPKLANGSPPPARPPAVAPRPVAPTPVAPTSVAKAPAAKPEPPAPPLWERRKDQRYTVKVTLSALNYGMFTECESVNASNDGMYIASSQMIPLFENIEISLVFQDLNKSIELGARVVWQNEQGERGLPRGVGVKFTNLTVEQKKFINWFVKKAQFEMQQAKR